MEKLQYITSFRHFSWPEPWPCHKHIDQPPIFRSSTWCAACLDWNFKRFYNRLESRVSNLQGDHNCLHERIHERFEMVLNKTKKNKKKQNLTENFWFGTQRCFFCFPWVFCFEREQAKKDLVFVLCFVSFWSKEGSKNQKNTSFFGFFKILDLVLDIVFDEKQKTLCFCIFWTFFTSIR